MKKQKVIVFFVFVLIVTGSLYFLSNYVYGLSSCLCSPDFYGGAAYCYAHEVYNSWIQVDTFCLQGVCNFQVDVLCEIPDSPVGQTYFRISRFTIARFSPGCCDDTPLYY